MRTTSEQPKRVSPDEAARRLAELKDKYHVVKVQPWSTDTYDALAVKQDAGFVRLSDDPEISGSVKTELWGIPKEEWERQEQARMSETNEYGLAAPIGLPGEHLNEVRMGNPEKLSDTLRALQETEEA